ncbi:hypothetical protein JS44_14650 [Anoxybacillus flavithermus]|uniref:Uncharacterized protein n=1 Tax=Anoxybacillus flavithermus TaxID=33934 RepID=A0A094IYM4_9BACL|nr:hypothetical protein JS44_14650 [Anoxybacillus flavithermus]
MERNVANDETNASKLLRGTITKMYEQCRSNGNKMMKHMMNYDRVNQQMMKQGHMNNHMM